jgi:hypothetical protein
MLALSVSQMIGNRAIMTSCGSDAPPVPVAGRCAALSGRGRPLCRLSGWTLLSTSAPVVFSPPSSFVHPIRVFNCANGDDDTQTAIVRPVVSAPLQQPMLPMSPSTAEDGAEHPATAGGQVRERLLQAVRERATVAAKG